MAKKARCELLCTSPFQYAESDHTSDTGRPKLLVDYEHIVNIPLETWFTWNKHLIRIYLTLNCVIILKKLGLTYADEGERILIAALRSKGVIVRR